MTNEKPDRQGRAAPPRVTLAHVASRAGVSTATVSLVLSDRQEYISQFRPSTVEKVRRTAERLGYRANIFASGLPGKATPFFALVIRDLGRLDTYSWHAWAFEGELLAGIVSVAAGEGLYPIVATLDHKSPDSGVRSTERVIAGGVLGSIVRAQNPPLEKFLRQQLRRNQRIVVIFPDQIRRWSENAIIADNPAIGRRAGRLLAAQGCRRWVFARYDIKGMRDSHALRLEGFRQVAEEVGAKLAILRLPRDTTEVNGAGARIRLPQCDGLFAADSVLSIGALMVCRRAGLRVGTDLRLVGVNCSRWSAADCPQITSVDISWREVGEIAMRELVRLTETGEHRFASVLVAPRVVPGETCPAPDPPPAP